MAQTPLRSGFGVCYAPFGGYEVLLAPAASDDVTDVDGEIANQILHVTKVLPTWDRSKVVESVRYIDKAGTDAAEGPASAYTAGCLMHRMSDKTYTIENMARGQWGALEREQKIKAMADADSANYKNYTIVVEQEPGSGGKESAENTIRNLAGFRVSPDKVTGSKEVRAQPFAAQVQGGNVSLVAGEWNGPFRDECESWPFGRYKDQIDAAAGAFNHLVKGTGYNTNYLEWAY